MAVEASTLAFAVTYLTYTVKYIIGMEGGAGVVQSRPCHFLSPSAGDSIALPAVREARLAIVGGVCVIKKPRLATVVIYTRRLMGWHMASFQPQKSIFQEDRALLEKWQPKEIVGRDEELQRLHKILQPVMNGEHPKNAFIYGKTGVGKTASTRYKLHDLIDSAEEFDIDVDRVWVNCNGLNSSYQVAIELTNKLAGPSEELPPTGLPSRTVYRQMWSVLDGYDDTVIIVLDEVDSIGAQDDLLYKLSRAEAEGDLSETEIGIIGISNDLSFRNKLDPRVQSSLCEREIQFSAYDSNELRAIMNKRAETAFHDDVLEGAVIPLCAALVTSEGGDARKGLDLLYEAGQVARDAGADTVTEEHVRTGWGELQRERIMEGLSECNQHEFMVLSAVLSLEINGETPARFKNIYPVYKSYATDVLSDVNMKRRTHDYLKDLSMLGILSQHERNQGRDGNYYEYELDIPSEMIMEALEKEDPVGIETATLVPPGLKRQVSAAN